MAMSTQKKWMIGCGGCLAVILVIVAIIAAIIFGAKSVSDNSVKGVFGETLPAGYTGFGIPMPQKGGNTPQSMVMLISTETKDMILAFKVVLDPTQKAMLESSDPQKLQEAMKSYLQGGGPQQKVSMEKLTVEGSNTVDLEAAKKKVKVVYLKTFSKKGVMPAVLTVLDTTDAKNVILVVIGAGETSPDEKADFGSSYTKLSEDLSQVITGSSLASQLK